MREAAARWLPVAGVMLAAGLFAALNRGERVLLNLGVGQVLAPLSVVAMAAFLFGMLAMLLLGLRQDLALRRALRERGLLDEPFSSPRTYDPLPARDDTDGL